MEAVYDKHTCSNCGGQANKVSAGYQEETCTVFQCTECGEYIKVKDSEPK